MEVENTEERLQAKVEGMAVMEEIVDTLLDNCVEMVKEEVGVPEEPKTKKGKKTDKNNNKRKKARFVL